MKIAVFLSGQVRLLDRTWKTILNTFHGHDVDYYFHFWEGGYSKDWMLDTFKPKNYLFQPQVNFSSQVTNLAKFVNKGYIFNVCSQHYSLCKAKDVIEDIDQYDFVAKLRTDLFFDNDLNHLIDIANDRLLISPHGAPPEDSNHLGDIAFFAKSQVFSKLFPLYDYLNQPNNWQNRVVKLTSHRILSLFINDNNIKFEHVPFRFVLLRKGIVGKTYEQLMVSHKHSYPRGSGKHHMFMNNNPDRVEQYKAI